MVQEAQVWIIESRRIMSILQVAETIWVNLNFNCPIYKISNSDIIHLFPAKSVEIIWGTKTFHHMDDPHKEIIRCLHTKRKQEVVISNLLIPYVPEDNTPPRRVPDQNNGVLLSFLLKGGPPDVPSKIKPIKNQGKALESQRRMKPDLLYLGAGYPVSRSKHFQEIGDDIGTETTPEPGANRMHHSANRRTNQDMCSVKTAHLSNQEKFYNETNFNAF